MKKCKNEMFTYSSRIKELVIETKKQKQNKMLTGKIQDFKSATEAKRLVAFIC